MNRLRRFIQDRTARPYVLIVLAYLAGCGPRVQHYVLVDQQLSRGEFAEADSTIEKNRKNYGERNAVLYYFDRGMTLHFAGRYDESNRFLALAERRIDDLYTRSVTAETGAMLTNDNTLPYEGEDFEKVMVNILSALNYVNLGQWDEALVEARKVDHKLSLLNRRYEKKNLYKEDAFAQYLSGILYEAKGEYNDAFIAYRKTYEAYQKYQRDYRTPMPPPLPADLLRMTAAVPLPEEHGDYLRQFPGATWESVKDLKAKAEVIFISFTGRAPIKEDFFIDAPIPEKQGVYHLRVALPRFVPLPNPVRTAEVHLIPSRGAKEESGPAGAISQRSFPVEDVSAIAKKNLEDRIGRITAKAIARATAKYLAAQKIRSEIAKSSDSSPLSVFLADVGTNVYSIVSEQSDKRSWRTLPDSILMARITAPPGTYAVAVEYYDETNGLIQRKEIQSVVLKAGEKKIFSNRVVGK